MRLQDAHGPVGPLAVFHNGHVIADVPNDDSTTAYQLRNQLAEQHPGCEVLARCTTHHDRAAVDCLDCWPLNEES